LEIFIAVTVVLVLLNLFFVFIIRALGARIGNFAQNNMLRQSSVFDELILRKEETLQGLLGSIETAEGRLKNLSETAQERTDYGVPTEFHSVTPGNYMDPDFSKDYKQIRENFVFDKVALVQGFAVTIEDEPEDERTLAARRTLDSLNADISYQLSTLTGDEQLSILNEVFDERQKALMGEYAEEHSSFETFEYVTWLNELIFRTGREIIVRTGMKSDDFNMIDKRIRTEYDDSLIEGLYVIHKGTMYDYSIRSKEISG
jgi:hypothetical protein